MAGSMLENTMASPGIEARPFPEEAVAIATPDKSMGIVPTVLMQSAKQRELCLQASLVNCFMSLIIPVEVSQWQNNNHLIEC